MTTLSGFLKYEIYQEISTHLIDENRGKDTIQTLQTIQSLCPLFVELALTNNEMCNLLSFCIDHYAKYVVSKNYYLQLKFNKLILFLLPYQNIHYDKKIIDTKFQNAISDLIVFLVKTTTSDIETKTWFYIQNQIQNNELIKEYEAEFMHHNKIFVKFAPLFSNVDGCISDRLFRKICVLMYCVRSNEYSVLLHIINNIFGFGLTYTKDKNEQSRIKEELQIHYFMFPEIRYMKPSFCADVFWVIWKGILSFMKKYPSKINNSVYGLFEISQIGFQKKNRKIRIILLIHALFLLTNDMKNKDKANNKKEEKFKIEEKEIEEIMNKVKQKIYALFQFKKEELQQEKLNEKEERQKHREIKKKQERDLEDKSIKNIDDCKNDDSNTENNSNTSFSESASQSLNGYENMDHDDLNNETMKNTIYNTCEKHEIKENKNIKNVLNDNDYSKAKKEKDLHSSEMSDFKKKHHKRKNEKDKEKIKTKTTKKTPHDDYEDVLPEYLNVVTYRK